MVSVSKITSHILKTTSQSWIKMTQQDTFIKYSQEMHNFFSLTLYFSTTNNSNMKFCRFTLFYSIITTGSMDAPYIHHVLYKILFTFTCIRLLAFLQVNVKNQIFGDCLMSRNM
jgi:hypothetical protein